MSEVTVNVNELTGQMNVTTMPDTKQQFDFSGSFTNISSKVPSIGVLIQQTRKNIRPWMEFLNTNNFKSVASVQRLTARFLRNLAFFQSNYLCVVMVLMIYCLITSPLILVVLAMDMFSCYKIRQIQPDMKILGRPLTLNQQYFIVNVAALPVLYIVGAGAALFWTLGASCFVISLHASFYNIDGIVTEDTENFLAEVV